MKFYKKLETYATIEKSQFILNIPLQLLHEIIENCENLEIRDIPHLNKEKKKVTYTKAEFEKLIDMLKRIK